MKRISSFIGLLLLLVAVGFSLWVYRLEPTSPVDPNDNTFQYALVDRTNHIFDFADKKCTGITKPFCMLSLLTDHWVPNWSEGYNLPFYYSHLPQVAIVLSYRLLSPVMEHVSLFTYYHVVTYLLLAAFPVSVYAALIVVGLSPIAAGFGAFAATQISTDGLYGLDPPSFLWRGWGLTSQLYAMIFLPLAIAYAYRTFRDLHPTRRHVLSSILFLAATTAGHLGIGIIAFISVGILAVSPALFAAAERQWSGGMQREFWTAVQRTIRIMGGVFLLLGYWIIPVFLYGNYHNTSVWDPIWKFDSYGARAVLTNLFNGNLFDFGRLPVMTALAGVGMFMALTPAEGTNRPRYGYFPFAVLFAVWLLLYFGAATWGRLIYLIPGMSDFHLSRFIVGVQMAGLVLFAIGIEGIATYVSRISVFRKFRDQGVQLVFYAAAFLLFLLIAVPQTLRYAAYNDTLITRAKGTYRSQAKDAERLLTTLSSYESALPGRIYAGRGGGWGKNFRVVETPMYMYLSTYGLPTVLWLPETWSPNADTEQYFRENVPEDYTLYNIRYVVTPSDLEENQIQPFWTLRSSSDSWRIYEVKTDGYVGTGVRPAVVSSGKLDYLNVVRLWIQSDDHKNGLYPELTFDKRYPKTTGLPNFRMLDETTFVVPDGSRHGLFEGNPRYVAPIPQPVPARVERQSSTYDMVFTARVSVPDRCAECVVILRQSYHPSWTATIDGKPAPTFAVFPFFTAVRLSTPGTHTVVFTYRPLPLKTFLLAVSLLASMAAAVIIVKKHV